MSRGRTCVFCGIGKATREDVFEQDLNTVLGITGRVSTAIGADAVPVRPPHGTLDVVVRATCQKCNNEWLSKIWTRFRDLMLPAMLNTSGVTLSIQGQKDVSMYAVKTALLLEMATKAIRGDAWLPMNHFTYLRREEHPPPGTEVWIFRVNAENKLPAWNRATVLGNARGSPTAYVATVTLGYLGMQVLGRKIVETHEGNVIFQQDDIKPPSCFDDVFQRVLPITELSVSWAPRITVSRAELSRVAGWPEIIFPR